MNLAKERVKIIGWEQDFPIILLKEKEEQTAETSSLLWDEAANLSNDKPFYLIVDLSESSPPTRDVRVTVKEKYLNMRSAILSTYVYVGNKPLMWITTKFIISAARAKNVHLINDIPAGLEMIKNNN